MKLREEIAKHMNPFSNDSDDLVTIVTQSVLPQKVTQDMVNAEQIGLSKYVSFVEKRIASNAEKYTERQNSCTTYIFAFFFTN